MDFRAQPRLTAHETMKVIIHCMTYTCLYSVHLHWCHTRCDLMDHCMQARKSAGKRPTLDLKPMRKDTQSPKQEQSVTLQNGPWSNKKIGKKTSGLIYDLNLYCVDN